MRITKAELYDRYYSASRNLYKGDTEMPNHCHNRVTFYASPEHNDQIAKIKQIFLDENCFGQIIPEPDWANTPNKDGELPVQPSGDNPYHVSWFKSTDRQDDRWYDWRIQNWDTKWDCYDVVVTDEDPECTEIEFNTAWSPPEAICHALREQYPDLSVSWFYDEPGCEIAGYL
jgi:hypothetical protein